MFYFMQRISIGRTNKMEKCFSPLSAEQPAMIPGLPEGEEAEMTMTGLGTAPIP